ncbi:putative DD41D transposase [Trichonephila clavipes]|nr:putative DD41D transposase [Trichonephila clavipes]
MYKNALKEDFIRVVQELDGIVENTDTIVKLKTKIENSSTFESDPDFVKTLIQNCIDERVSQNEREETATHIGIREAEDWFRPIDLAKECDIYISSRSGSHKEIPITYGYTQDPFKNRSQNFKTKIKENYPQYHERENKIALYAAIHLITQETRMVEVKPINISLNQHSTSLSVRTAISPTLTEEFIIHPSVYSEIEKLGHAKSDVLLNESESSLGTHAYAYSSAISFPNVSVSNVIKNCSYDLPYVKNFNTRNDSSSLIKDYKCNNIKSTKLKMCIKLKNDIPVCQRARRLSCSEKLQVNNQIDDWLRQGIIKESVFDYCSDIVLCKKANDAMKTSSVEFISRSPNPLPMKSKHHRFVLFEKSFSLGSGNEGKREIVLNRRPELYRGKYRCVQLKINLFSSGLHGNTAADSVRSGWPLWHAAKSKTSRRAQAHQNGDRFNSCQVIYSQFGLAIHQNDHQARRRFVEWAQNEIAVVPDFHKRILFSDEAHFWLNGYVNKQNCRIWSEANPQVYVETPLHPEKLAVWCALWAGGIIGPYFFKNDEGHNVTVNGDRYRAMITNFFIPELNNHDVQELWFQQDGATCHTARATIDLLKDTFGDRLTFWTCELASRSCDLTPLDYFLWGYVKSLVYADNPQTLDHLEDNIPCVIADIRPQMLEKVIENWTSRLDYIRASRGSDMREIIFKM